MWSLLIQGNERVSVSRYDNIRLQGGDIILVTKKLPAPPQCTLGQLILNLLSALWKSWLIFYSGVDKISFFLLLLFESVSLFVDNFQMLHFETSVTMYLSHSALMLLCAITDKPIYLDTTFQYLVRIQLQLDNNTRSKGGNIRRDRR